MWLEVEIYNERTVLRLPSVLLYTYRICSKIITALIVELTIILILFKANKNHFHFWNYFFWFLGN